MEKKLALQFEFDIKTVRRAVALISGEAMTDEEINAKFFDRESVTVSEKLLGSEAEVLQFCTGLVLLVLNEGELEKEPKPKSKWQQRLDEMAEKRKANN